MHVSSDRDPVKIKGWNNVLLVAGIFPWGYLLHVEGIHFLEDCTIRSEVRECVRGNFTQVVVSGPQEKLHKEIGGLEDWRKIYVVSIQSMIYVEGFYWELDSFWAKASCNLWYVLTCLIYR